MKKNIKNLLLFATLSNITLGASVDYLMNQSPSYLGNPAQNAVISVDGASYNPAGLVHLEDGRYLQIGNQFGFIHEGMKSEGVDYDSDTFEPVIPHLNLVYKKGTTATYFNLGVIGGGSTLEYDDGVPGSGKIPGLLNPLFPDASMKSSAFEGSNKYFAATLGRAWAVNEKLSFSAAGRLIYASREIKGYAEYENVPSEGAIHVDKADFSIDSERTAWGVGGVFGVNYMPNEKWNFAARYETRVKLEFEADAKNEDAIFHAEIPSFGIDKTSNLGFLDFYPQYADGDKRYRDLPAVLAMGIAHNATEKLTLSLGGNYYFIKDADLDGASGYDNGYDINVGMEYTINPTWSWTLGYNYADTGASRETYSDVEYALNSQIIGTGIKYRPSVDEEWVFTVAKIIYDTNTVAGEEKELLGKKVASQPIKYEKGFLSFGVSYTRRF